MTEEGRGIEDEVCAFRMDFRRERREVFKNSSSFFLCFFRRRKEEEKVKTEEVEEGWRYNGSVDT